ncbi:metallophosphoesterase [Streptomyces sp. 378]|uniref:metallophosphoesterase n=1 Tax=Streptomyces sp. 378 TaxID=3049412 RepID=UPI0024C3C415|nr:metallophosphoesterase [Streptomyces sp. 378]MDK1343189.1 metallophosphoesterase [Streptomyces sp. 378]
MVIVFVLVASLVLAVVVTANWYVWRRLFRDTTSGPGLVRRAGAVLIAGGWFLAITALVAERAGAPFRLQQVLAWPGFLWLALSIYLLLAVLAGELVRPLLRRFLEHRARRTNQERRPATTAEQPTDSEPGPHAPAGATAPDSPAGRTPTASLSPGADGPQGNGSGAGTPAAAPREHAGDTPTAPASTAPVPAAPVSQAGGSGGAAAPGTAPTTASRTGDSGGVPVSGTAPAPASQPGRARCATAVHPQGDPAADTPEASPQPSPAAPPSPSRRLFVSRVVAGAAAAAAVGTVGYGTYGVLRGPKVKRVTVPLAKLPRAAHGYRIAVVSDVHLGPVLGRGFAQKVVDTINAAQPDLIAVVGDLVDGSVKDLGPAAAPLAQLRARHGSYFVTGNHEYFSGAEQWLEEIRRLGIAPLENARREMPYFDLAGVNDVAGEDEGQGPDFAKALGDRDTARACVLLAHQPVQIHDAVEHGVDLQLSGHTHGGQLWPGNIVASGANPTLAGLERYGDTQLYVSRGAGAWGPPTRVGAPSDITVIELASKQA